MGPHPAVDARHADAGIGRRCPIASISASIDEPAALRGGGEPPLLRCGRPEPGLKYFVLGALSSGMLLYGASLVYGFTGTVSFAGIAQSAAEGVRIDLRSRLSVRRLLLQGLGRRRSICWQTPDVYEGAPTPVMVFFAGPAPKVAGIAELTFVRAAVAAFPGIAGQWQEIVVFVAIASMLRRLRRDGQRNIKRLMAYSSIGHMDFALDRLAAGTAEGVQGVLIYMAIYASDDARRVLRADPVDAAQERNGGIDRPARRPCPLTRRWRSSWRCSCSRWPAHRRLPVFAKFSMRGRSPGFYVLAVVGALSQASSAPTTIWRSSR